MRVSDTIIGRQSKGHVARDPEESGIGESEILRTREPGHHKSRNPENQSGPSVREDRWQRIRYLQSLVHRSFDGKEIVQQEIAICDFPMRSEPFMMRTHVRGSRGIGVRQFEILDNKKLTTGGILKPRNATVPES
jgi:hypothetical protein